MYIALSKALESKARTLERGREMPKTPRDRSLIHGKGSLFDNNFMQT